MTGRAQPAALLRGADAIVLDCDGVLVGVSASYDRTIALTVGRLLAALGISARLDVDAALIEGFKATGGFNDEVDLAYAAALCAAAAEASGRGARALAAWACGSLGAAGIAGVEARLAEVADVSAAAEALGHPGPNSRVRAEFNRVFYGRAMHARLFGGGPGMIERDALLVGVPEIRALRRATGRRPAVVTGRGRAPFEHTVRDPLRSEFDLESSAFLEDEPRAMAKPSPAPLARALGSMGSARALYVGDSMEDLLVARAAARGGLEVSFCGVTGTARDPEERRRMFESAGADATAASVAGLAALVR